MSLRAMVVAVLAAGFCLWPARESNAGDRMIYSNDFRDHYPRVGRRFDLSRYLLESPGVRWDAAHARKITIRRTRGDRYGYEQQKCVLTVEGEGLQRARVLSVLGFRDVEASWITGKLVAIKLDIGHVAGVDAIYDVEADKLIYCESVTYIIEPEGAPGESRPVHPAPHSAPLRHGSGP